jgi:hypothetical protein
VAAHTGPHLHGHTHSSPSFTLPSHPTPSSALPPVQAFLYSYLPLEAEWQLIRDPISMDAWWDLPECSVPFFARGCKLVGDELRSVNVSEPRAPHPHGPSPCLIPSPPPALPECSTDPPLSLPPFLILLCLALLPSHRPLFVLSL